MRSLTLSHPHHSISTFRCQRCVKIVTPQPPFYTIFTHNLHMKYIDIVYDMCYNVGRIG